MYQIEIFVPTYNREKYLKKLYESLLAQDYKDFSLLIIDDGSSDKTKELVESWKIKNEIKFRYFYQENQGKHIAYNKAIKESQGELFLELDSDDYLLPNALSTIVNEWNLIKDKENYAGIQCLCCKENGETLGSDFVRVDTNNYELRYIDKIKGDKGMIYHVSKLKQFSFPEIKNEIVPESILHNRISQNLKTRCLNKKLIVKQYLEDGLTKQHKTKHTSAFSKVIMFNELNYHSLSFGKYILISSRYVKLSLLKNDNYSQIYKDAINKRFYFLLAYFLGWISYRKAK